jgi:heat shock protein HslJ
VLKNGGRLTKQKRRVNLQKWEEGVNMKTIPLLILSALIFSGLLPGCAVTPPAKPEASKEPAAAEAAPEAPPPAPVVTFENIKNTVWQLNEIKMGYGSIMLDRALFSASQMGDYYTLQFITEGASGRAAPNRYFAPYALISDHDIAIRPIAGTMMASLNSIGVLAEQRYFAILQSMTRWDLKDGVLQVYAPGENPGEEITMIFKSAQ